MAVIETFSLDEVQDALLKIQDQIRLKGVYAAGFISYEAGPAFDDSYQTVTDDVFPKLWFGLFQSLRKLEALPDPGIRPGRPVWVPELKFPEYQNRIKVIKKHIEQGDTYQVNYTYRLRTRLEQDPFCFFTCLAQSHDPPFAAFVDTGQYSVCSFSPELFFKLTGDILESRPMKGTLARRPAFWPDQSQALMLRSCDKNRAENVMITDMVRNDLGRIADPGSVEVKDLFQAEKYPTLWQMTSRVSCRTRARLGSVMGALFPPSSITGAPKPSTMKIIAGLEVSPRRIYTGCIGYAGPGRRAQFNVAIRTVLVDNRTRQAEYGVGGGIVWDSTPEDEWNECKTKSRALHRISPEFSLLESILWTGKGGYHLLGAHMARLKESGVYFDFCVDMKKVLSSLREFGKNLGARDWKVRLLVDKTGRIRIQKQVVEDLPSPFLLSLAAGGISSDDPFLYHKTTSRRAFDDAGSSNPKAHSTLFWNERGEITEASMANIALEIGGILWTPPVRSGLLAGTYRQFLLASGVLQEKVLYLEDMQKCSGVFLINSVRGMFRAKLT
ncbi:chorismate-binding protein [Desulfonatronovibrio hydrogenovorans]|uniref:chorismate-binding protein n=1 Tax=Desulfonatronovibrio hydrogenovorans TaxID=53245 RepID=UPI001377C94E|nr:chorismate-binding protein [Desulfonatronovibrio hydrogenovorans]